MLAFLPRFPTPIRSPRLTPRLATCTASPPQPPPQSPAKNGHLYIVSTPIGNPTDLTFRALTILHTVSIIAAEDTRRTGLLLSSYNLRHSQRLLSCHEHNWRTRVPQLIQYLHSGQSIALVSDAGTPCVSDPGVQLVNSAIENGLNVVPVPGPCAALAALVASGMGIGGFWFVGFLPRGGKERREMIGRLGEWEGSVVLYEAPHRLRDTLAELHNGRPVCVAREVTKKWEQFLRFSSVGEAIQYYEAVEPRGEFTIVLGGKKTEVAEGIKAFGKAEVNVETLVKAMVKEGVPVSAVARCVAGAVDVPKKMVYAFADTVKSDLGEERERSGV